MNPASRKRPTAYLSGGKQYAASGGADWREALGNWLRQELGHRVVDPVRESRRLMARMRAQGMRLRGKRRVGGDWPAFFRRIVDADTRWLTHGSDYVVCLWNGSARKGAGTQGEITIARWRRIPVYVVSRTPLDRMPGWIQGCVACHFRSFADLKRFLVAEFESIQ